jgi:NADH-quinone oxidoreductase subunit E
MSVAETAAPMAPALKVLAEMSPVREKDIIPLLQRLQDQYGYLPREVILEVAARAGLPASRIYGVATFYAQFRLHPSGRHTVRCCRGTACHVKGGKKVAEAARSVLGVEEGETTPDFEYTLDTVACIGCCALAPNVVVNKNVHGHMNPKKLASIFGHYGEKKDGSV